MRQSKKLKQWTYINSTENQPGDRMSREASMIVLWHFRLISPQGWKRQFCLQSNLQHSLNNAIMSAHYQYLSGVNPFFLPNSHHTDCERESPWSMARGMLWPTFRRLGHWLKQRSDAKVRSSQNSCAWEMRPTHVYSRCFDPPAMTEVVWNVHKNLCQNYPHS